MGVWGVEKSSNSKKRRLGSEVKRDKSSLNNKVSSQFGRRLVRGRKEGRREREVGRKGGGRGREEGRREREVGRKGGGRGREEGRRESER